MGKNAVLSKDLACPFLLLLSLSLSPRSAYACARKKKEGGGGGENLEEGNTGDVLRQVADTKGTGHSPTPGYFIPCLVPYLNPSRPFLHTDHLERVHLTGAPECPLNIT